MAIAVKHIGFLGAGRMATALAGGCVRAGLVAGDQLLAGDPSDEARSNFANAVPGATVTHDNELAVRDAEIVIVAVKPDWVAPALRSVDAALGSDTLVVSIAAGIPIASLAACLPLGTRTVRAMPNTPRLVGRGATCYSLGPNATPEDGRRVAEIFRAVGDAHQVDESLLDAVTGLSGSGPAFVFAIIESLSDGGVAAGLPRPLADALAIATVRGAAEMAATTGEHPAVLRDRVTSPGGTTAAGLSAMDRANVRGGLISAIEEATSRSRELGRPK